MCVKYFSSTTTIFVFNNIKIPVPTQEAIPEEGGQKKSGKYFFRTIANYLLVPVVVLGQDPK